MLEDRVKVVSKINLALDPIAISLTNACNIKAVIDSTTSTQEVVNDIYIRPLEKSQAVNNQPLSDTETQITIKEAVPVHPINFYDQNLKERLLFRAEPVQKLLQLLTRKESFSIAGFKRTMHTIWKINNADTAPTIDYQSPAAMFDSKLFIAGRTKLDSNLNVVARSRLHCRHCDTCSKIGVVVKNCYFHQMMECIVKGGQPPIKTRELKPKYKYKNSPKIEAYELQTQPEMEEMIKHKVVRLGSIDPNRVLNPLGVVITNSDLQRAKTLMRITVHNSESLKKASEALVAAGHPRIKCRISTDCSGSGINEAAYSPTFQYSTVSDGVRVVVRDGYLATADVSRYFFEFPWAESIRVLFSFIFLGSLFEYLKLCFGFTSCPYYCSTWSAEFYQWFKCEGIEAAFLMDDWMVGAAGYKEAKRKITYICETIQSVGFTMAKEKGKIGQQIVWLGILIDTVKMTIRIEAVQARA